MGTKKSGKNIRKAKIAFVILLLMPVAAFFYMSYITLEVKEIKMQIKVDDVIGINVDNSSLNFGKTYPESLVYRKINLSNNHNFQIKITILNSGDISKFVYVSENDFLLNPKELRQVTYYVEIPENAEYKNYTGISRIVFKRKL